MSAPVLERVNTARLRDFVTALADLLDRTSDEAEILDKGGVLLGDLVAHDDWLPEAFATPSPDRYQQYLLHCDSAERFSVVSFVWGPGQGTPIHDHTVWGLVGILRGREESLNFRRQSDGSLAPEEPALLLNPGEVEALSPARGDIHQVRNALADAPSISIHVYGANIGAVRRSTFTPDGEAKLFISGYANALVPNLWDRSK